MCGLLESHIQCPEDPEVDHPAYRLLHPWWRGGADNESQAALCHEEVL